MFGDVLEFGQYVKDAQAVLIGGGTFVPKYPQNPQLVALSSNLPTVMFGTGIGDPLFWGKEHIPAWLQILHNARFIGVRGPLSRRRLGEWGFPVERVEIVGDTALYFAVDTLSGRHEPGSLAVNLGTTYNKLYGFDEAAVERAVIEALKRLAKDDWRITLVCAWQPDDVAVDRIVQQVPVASVEHWHDDFQTALASMAKFDLVLSEKLHVGVIAACHGVPFVALNYRSKVLDFCSSIGWEAFCLETDRLEAEQIMEKIAILAGDREQCADRLHRAVSQVKRQLIEAIPRAVSALQAPHE